MNKEKRNTLADISAKLTAFTHSDGVGAVQLAWETFEAAKMVYREACEAAATALESLMGDIDTEWDDEREKLDNMPEGLQQSDRGLAMEEALDAMNDAREEVDNAIIMLRDEDYDATDVTFDEHLENAVDRLGDAAA